MTFINKRSNVNTEQWQWQWQWLILVNVLVFVVARVSMSAGMEWVASGLMLPATFQGVLAQPWSVVTYMFTQYDLWHLLANMAMLCWFGRLTLSAVGSRGEMWLYAIGGLAGAACYLATGIVPRLSIGPGLIGASSAVIGVIVGGVLTMPNRRVNMWLIGDVRLRWVALIILMIFVAGGIAASAGTFMAHIGGALGGVGWYVVGRVRRGMRRTGRKSSHSADNCDAILDKIKRSGFASLSEQERRTLFELSSHLNNK